MRRYRVTVDGVPFTLDVEETAADRFAVSVGGQVFEARLEAAADLPGTEVTPGMPPVGGAPAAPALSMPELTPRSPVPVPLPEATGSRQAPTAVTAAPAAPAGSATATNGPVAAPPPERRPAGVVAAPMPGVVLEVRVSRGEVVRRGDPLLVLEAMKMRNTIRAPRDGVVAEVTTEAGRPVGPGEPLLRLADPPR